MNVTVEGSQLRCSFRYDKRIVERIKLVSGATFDKATRAWYLPVLSMRRVFELFPKASYAYECFALEQEQGGLFVAGLRNYGIDLHRDDAGNIVATGAGVSPVLENAIFDRREWLRPHIEARKPKNGAERGEKGSEHIIRHAKAETHDDTPPATASDDIWESARERRIAEAYLAGMKNAATAEERTKRIVEAKRKRKKDLVQARLI